MTNNAEQLAELIAQLGDKGLTAFYVSQVVDLFEMLGVFAGFYFLITALGRMLRTLDL